MKNVVILGGGYGGTKVLNKLQKSSTPMKITIIDRHEYHCEKIDLMDVASGLISDRKICFAIEDIIDRKKTKFIQDTVEVIDHENNKVSLNKNGEISYDYLVVALGFHSETFNIPGVSENSLPMDTVTAADNIHQHIINEMQQYKKDNDPIHLKIIVCGAGFTGVELLGSLNDMKEQYAKLAGVNKDQIVLECVDHSSKFLPMFNTKLSDYGLKWMHSHVKFYSQCGIKEIKPHELIYTDSNNKEYSLAAGTIIWTTGVSGSNVIQKSGYPEHRGRVRVKNDLRSPIDDNVFIIGDVAAFSLTEVKGHILQQLKSLYQWEHAHQRILLN